MGAEPRVVVAGDVSIEWLLAQSRVLFRSGALLEAGYYMQCYREAGGAPKLGELIDATASLQPRLGSVLRPNIDELPKAPSQLPYWHEYMLCSLRAKRIKSGKGPDRLTDSEPGVWRVRHLLGIDRQFPQTPLQPLIRGDDGEADLVVIEEGDKGFADHRESWPKSFLEPQNDKAQLLLRWIRPDLKQATKSALWQHAVKHFGGRIALVVTVDDLRLSPMRISRALSWERAIEDLEGELRSIWETELSGCAHLIVSFFAVGAVVFSAQQSGFTGRLYYDPLHIQETWAQDYPGLMFGYTRCLSAAVAMQMLIDPHRIGDAIIPALHAQRKLHVDGFLAEGQLRDDTALPETLTFPTATISELIREKLECQERAAALVRDGIAGEPTADPPTFVERALPANLSRALTATDDGKWKILREVMDSEATIIKQAKKIVEEGIDSYHWSFPVARFGDLFATDRTEIEGFRAIGALITNYMGVSEKASPLSIAVFGTPGSGKSFGIRAVAEHLASKQESRQTIKARTFNLSQFSSPEAINNALQQVRDDGLSGAMPLVFWDEFDTTLGPDKLGWLRYFLAPMQDGLFQEGPVTHNIGRAIFVFAGGTHKSMDEFKGVASTRTGKRSKVTDFLSRLKGFVEVLGLDYPDPARIEPSIALRRAVLLHAFLKESAGDLVQRVAKAGEPLMERINVDTGIVEAFLRIPKYEYAARSMESIVKMSAISGKSMFERSSLAPSEQMRIHVDARAFLNFVQPGSAGIEPESGVID